MHPLSFRSRPKADWCLSHRCRACRVFVSMVRLSLNVIVNKKPRCCSCCNLLVWAIVDWLYTAFPRGKSAVETALRSTGRLRSALPWTLGFPPPASSVALACVNRYKWAHQWELSTQQIGWGCRSYGVGGMLTCESTGKFISGRNPPAAHRLPCPPNLWGFLHVATISSRLFCIVEI